MTILELRRAARAAGFTHYRTMAGLRPLEAFDPYGLAPADPETDQPAGPNWRPTGTQYAGNLDTDRARIVDADDPARPCRALFALGVFPLDTVS